MSRNSDEWANYNNISNCLQWIWGRFSCLPYLLWLLVDRIVALFVLPFYILVTHCNVNKSCLLLSFRIILLIEFKLNTNCIFMSSHHTYSTSAPVIFDSFSYSVHTAAVYNISAKMCIPNGMQSVFHFITVVVIHIGWIYILNT